AKNLSAEVLTKADLPDEVSTKSGGRPRMMKRSGCLAPCRDPGLPPSLPELRRASGIRDSKKGTPRQRNRSIRTRRLSPARAALRPMADVGPVDLDEARRVLSDRLLTLDSDPPARRFGRIFVGTPNHARGRAFRVVFVPGLAERMFPQKPREDPLLLDDRRRE